MRKQVAPALDLFQKRAVYFGGAAFAFGADGVFVERAFEYRVLGKYRGDLIPLCRVVAEGAVEQPRLAGLVVFVGLLAAVINGEFLEVGDDGQRQLGRPRIAA